MARAQDASLARALAADLYLKRSLAWDGEFERKVEALTGAEILAAMRRFLDPAKLTMLDKTKYQKE